MSTQCDCPPSALPLRKNTSLSAANVLSRLERSSPNSYGGVLPPAPRSVTVRGDRVFTEAIT